MKDSIGVGVEPGNLARVVDPHDLGEARHRRRPERHLAGNRAVVTSRPPTLPLRFAASSPASTRSLILKLVDKTGPYRVCGEFRTVIVFDVVAEVPMQREASGPLSLGPERLSTIRAKYCVGRL